MTSSLPNSSQDPDSDHYEIEPPSDDSPAAPCKVSATELPRVLRELQQKVRLVATEIEKCVIGQDDSVDAILFALLSRGHCLIEGVPGLVKTLLVRALAQVLELEFKRVQFTPDLMPADITGTSILQDDESGRRQFEFVKGPVFTQILSPISVRRNSMTIFDGEVAEYGEM